MLKVAQKFDFTGKTIYVGLDVHLLQWNVSIYLENNTFFKAFQQAANPGQLVRYLEDNFPGAQYQCAYEAGFCGFWIQRELTKRGLQCIIVNAADIPTTDKAQKNKTNKRDSKRIGLSLQAGQLDAIYIPSIQLESDRRLVRFRKRIQIDLTKARNRIKSELHLMGQEIPERYKGWSKSFVTWLKGIEVPYSSLRYTLDQLIVRVEQLRAQLLELNRKLRKLIREDRYLEMGELLMKVTGLGLITSITLLTEIGEIERFPFFDQFNNYIGFCPTEHSSGEDEHKGKITPRSNRVLRGYFIEAAWMAIRNDPAMAACYSKLLQRMTGKRAITRIARKLLNRVYWVWKTKRVYTNGIN